MKQKLLLLSTGLLLSGCVYTPMVNPLPNTDNQEEVAQEEPTTSSPVKLSNKKASPAQGDPGIMDELDENFKDMDQKEKETIFHLLDGFSTPIEEYESKDIETDYGRTFISIEKIKPESDIGKIIEEESFEYPVLIYMNFNSCHYCQAFTPKLAKLADDYGINVYQYNQQDQALTIQDHEKASEYLDSLTVPALFLVENGESVAMINHEAPMENIETLVKYVADHK